MSTVTHANRPRVCQTNMDIGFQLNSINQSWMFGCITVEELKKQMDALKDMLDQQFSLMTQDIH